MVELLRETVQRDNYEKIEHYHEACRIMARAIDTALDKQLRVNENVMRQEQFDRLPEIIALIQAEEKRLYS